MLKIAVGDVVAPFSDLDLERLPAGVQGEFYGEDQHIVILEVPDGMCDSEAVNALRPGHPNIRRRRDIRV